MTTTENQITEAFSLLRRARLLINHSEDGHKLFAEIDRYLSNSIKPAAGGYQVTCVDPKPADLNLSLGISHQRLHQLADDIVDAIKMDVTLHGMTGRPKNPATRLLVHASKNCTNANETAMVSFLVHAFLDAVQNDPGMSAAVAMYKLLSTLKTKVKP